MSIVYAWFVEHDGADSVRRCTATVPAMSKHCAAAGEIAWTVPGTVQNAIHVSRDGGVREDHVDHRQWYPVGYGSAGPIEWTPDGAA